MLLFQFLMLYMCCPTYRRVVYLYGLSGQYLPAVVQCMGPFSKLQARLSALRLIIIDSSIYASNHPSDLNHSNYFFVCAYLTAVYFEDLFQSRLVFDREQKILSLIF